MSDQLEDLFWAILRRFEVAALQHYDRQAPYLATATKRAYVAQLEKLGSGTDPLVGSDLAEPVSQLLEAAANHDEATTLIAQGLFLEYLGQAIYRVARDQPSMSEASRALASSGFAASSETVDLAVQRLAAKLGSGDQRFALFVEASRDLIEKLDALGEGVDRTFGERFQMHFRDIMGDFSADLLPACVQLGMTRRKVVAHLAGALMGF